MEVGSKNENFVKKERKFGGENETVTMIIKLCFEAGKWIAWFNLIWDGSRFQGFIELLAPGG